MGAEASAASPVAFAALILWPVVVAVLFRKLLFQAALVWSVLAGYLLLPSDRVVGIDLPLLPALDKVLIPSLAAAVMAVLALRRLDKKRRLARTLPGESASGPLVLPGWLPSSILGLGLFVTLIASTFMSTFTNSDPLVYGDTFIPQMRTFDSFSLILAALVVLLPAMLGRKFLADDAGHRHILVAICAAAVVYSFLMLYEVRMSPQINMMVYGFFPHSWLQHVRGGGFRPIVFMNHGLVLGIFLSMAVVASAIMVRLSTGAARMRFFVAMLFLFAVLVLSKNLGALMITILLVPIALLAPVRIQLLAAAGCAGIMLSYPMLRGADIIPAENLVEFAAGIDERRAQSLDFRFHHEDALLEKANERPVFGWGSWSRWRVFDETGRDITVSDGAWIINISQRGWLGYIAKFGFLTLPLLLLFLRRKRYQVGLATSGLCLIVAANLVDLLPNDSLSPLLWLATGALLGRLELKTAEHSAEIEPPDARTAPIAASAYDQGAQVTSYSRFPHTHRRGAPVSAPRNG